MSHSIPPDVRRTIQLLRYEAKVARDKERLADELERIYGKGIAEATGDDSSSSASSSGGEGSRQASVQSIKDFLNERGARPKDLADYFGVTVPEIQVLINESGGELKIADRGWVKVREGTEK
jgi:hypothetical protein